MGRRHVVDLVSVGNMVMMRVNGRLGEMMRGGRNGPRREKGRCERVRSRMMVRLLMMMVSVKRKLRKMRRMLMDRKLGMHHMRLHVGVQMLVGMGCR